MNGREKIDAAFSMDGSPEIAAVICYEEIFIRDHWTQLTSCPWWYHYELDIDKQMIWRRDELTKTSQDWFILPTFYTKEQRKNLYIDVRNESAFLVDRCDGEERELKAPKVGGEMIIVSEWDKTIQTPEDIDDYLLLSANENKSKMIPGDSNELAGKLIKEFGEEKHSLYHVSSPLWCCYQLWGFEGMMTRLITQPDLIKYACSRYLIENMEQVQLAKILGATVIWIEECFTDMISPEMFQTFNMPYIRPLIEEIRKTGLKSIYYYTGNPDKKMDKIIDCNADALAFEESKKGFFTDIVEIADIVKGRCVLLGNIDSIGVMQNGGTDELKAEIARQLNAAKKNKNRFIVSIGSPVTPSTPVEKVHLYGELVHELSKRR